MSAWSKLGIDWTAEQDAVVVAATQAIAVYENQRGDVVIAQQAPDGDDGFVVIRREHVAVIVEAILRTAGLDFSVPERLAHEKKDSTAAERQRRFREKHRNAAVTPIGRDVTRDERDALAAE